MLLSKRYEEVKVEVMAPIQIPESKASSGFGEPMQTHTYSRLIQVNQGMIGMLNLEK